MKMLLNKCNFAECSFKKLIVFYMFGSLTACISMDQFYALCVEIWKSASDLQELELPKAVNFHRGTENWTLIFWKSNQYT